MSGGHEEEGVGGVCRELELEQMEEYEGAVNAPVDEDIDEDVDTRDEAPARQQDDDVIALSGDEGDE